MRPAIRSPEFVALALLALPILPSAALASTLSLRAELTGANEVPANERPAKGTLMATYDTVSKKLTWTGAYSGLSGKPTSIHFHGPANPNQTAAAVLPINSMVEGSATLTDTQAQDLIAGYWYVDIHTRAHPRGEIRGQVLKGR